ncbi:hypothetical protein BaRGS_00007524, partial [Batillaria attramentaria]
MKVLTEICPWSLTESAVAVLTVQPKAQVLVLAPRRFQRHLTGKAGVKRQGSESQWNARRQNEVWKKK